ncbi:hypothetical protein RB195_009803 [Necator americanus]|uniref:tRNA-intron lyase n=1 Tax=Necator americanus TaxID=51031 RepID=A0ABR1CV11_NECAM
MQKEEIPIEHFVTKEFNSGVNNDEECSSERNDDMMSKNDSRFIAFKKIDPNEEQHCWLNEFEVPMPCTRDHRARNIVFHDLWRKGYYLTSGEQYGCAYLVYEGIPGEVHAKYLLDFVMDDEEASMINIISLVRVATQVKKELLLAVVASDSSHPHYISFNRFRPYSKEYE